MFNDLRINEYLEGARREEAIVKRLTKWMNTDTLLPPIHSPAEVRLPLEHLVVFLNQGDLTAISPFIPSEHKDRFIWMGDLLNKVIKVRRSL